MPAAMPSSHSVATDEPAFFSNTGEIAFKPSVRIYCGSEVRSAASPAADFDAADAANKTVLHDKGAIETGYHAIAGEKLGLTVEENAKLLAKMCIKARAPTTPDANLDARQRYGSPYKSRLTRLSMHEEDGLCDFDTAAPVFERLVQEYLHEGEPEFEQWMELNPKRKLQSYADAREMYEQIQTGIRAPWNWNWFHSDPPIVKRAKEAQARSDMIKKTKHKAVDLIHDKETEQGINRAEQAYQDMTQRQNSHAHARLDGLESHTNEIATGLKQNHRVLQAKFAQIDAKLDANLASTEHVEQIEDMGEAMMQNNATIQDKFKQIDERMDAHAHMLDTHEQGLLTHHGDLERMGSDLRMQAPAMTQGAVTLAASAPQKRLGINELNAMACKF